MILGTGVGTLLSSSLVAYPLARMDFPGKNLFFSVIVGTMLVPGISLIIPQYMMYSKLGWLGHAAADDRARVVCIPLQRVPVPAVLPHDSRRNWTRAAAIDGCGRVRAFFRVLVPLSKPTFATVFVLSSGVLVE